MLPAATVPSFGGKGSSSASYEETATLWSQVTNSESGKQAAALILPPADATRQVRMTSGKGDVLKNDGARQILRISRERSAPDAADTI